MRLARHAGSVGFASGRVAARHGPAGGQIGRRCRTRQARSPHRRYGAEEAGPYCLRAVMIGDTPYDAEAASGPGTAHAERAAPRSHTKYPVS